MSKKKQPVDPFGLSLLDVLSNALGATILLVLIVAVTSRGNADQKKATSEESGEGKTSTVLKFKISKNPIDTGLYMIQFKFYHGSAELRVKDDNVKDNKWEIFRQDTLTNQCENNLPCDSWLIKQKGKFRDQDNMQIELFSKETSTDSVEVTIFKSNMPICLPEGRSIEENNSKPLLKLNGGGEASILGKLCLK